MILVLQTMLFTPIVYFVIQFEASFEQFIYFCILFFESLALYTFYGQMLVFVTPTPQVAQVLGACEWKGSQTSSDASECVAIA